MPGDLNCDLVAIGIINLLYTAYRILMHKLLISKVYIIIFIDMLYIQDVMLYLYHIDIYRYG